MIEAEKKHWSGNQMMQRESFDEYYQRKLEALVIELKRELKSGIPYVVSAQYACAGCKARILYHSMDGRIYCLRCQLSLLWSKEMKRCVFQILQSYPSLEECRQEWEANQAQPKPRVLTGQGTLKVGDEELGRKMREAREGLGWTQEELAHKIYRKDGRRIAKTSIQGYETAHARPSKGVLEQIVEILGLKGIQG